MHGGRRVGRHRDNEVRRVDDEARVVAGAAERRRPADRDDGARADLAARLGRGARGELRDHRRARVVAEDEDGVGGVVFAAQRLLDARDDPWQLLALDEFRQRVGRRRSGVVPERLERDAPGPRGGFGRHCMQASVRTPGPPHTHAAQELKRVHADDYTRHARLMIARYAAARRLDLRISVGVRADGTAHKI